MDYRSIIQNEYEARLSFNPNYSLRAFARDIEVSPSQLTDILKSKKGLSTKKALIVANKLGLNEKEALTFKAMVECQHGRSDKIRKLAAKYLEESLYQNNYKSLSEDSFAILANWYHFAILSCMELDHYDGSIGFLVNKLSLSYEEVETAIKRMLREEMIDLNKGKFVVKKEMYTTSHDIESKALKVSHKQTLKQAIDCVDSIPVELRDITSITMAIDIDKLPEAKEKIKNFRRSMSKFLESAKKTDVYNINIQLVPVSKVQ